MHLSKPKKSEEIAREKKSTPTTTTPMKLSNLLLTENGVLKLADFGLARQLNEKAFSADKREKFTMS